MNKNRYLIIFFFFCINALFAQNFREANGAFSFNVLDMDPSSEVSCRDLNTEITNESPRMVVDKEGHLSVGGKRVRIFGTNLSAFPEKDQAERNAKSLADRGFNCIRFHHTDADWVSCFIKKNQDGKRVIDAAGLDKFDYFVYMLKKYGIYVNLNLLTGRTYTEKDGMPSGTDKISDWKNRHILGFWNEQARNLQKDYAKRLLEHVNPYTGIALKDDPALCIVEINNEQGMLHSYFSNNFYDTPDNLWNELELLWNKWLINKGYSYESLSALYNQVYPYGKNLINEKNRWNLEQHSGAKASKSGENNNVIVNVSGNGTAGWHVQLNTAGLKIESVQVYTVSLRAKASKKVSLSLGLMMAHDPWSNLGWNKNIEVDTQWKNFSFVITGLQADSNARLNIGNMGFLSGTKIEFEKLEMKEGGNIVSVKETPRGVMLPKSEDYWELPENLKNLVLNFFYDIETAYWTDMRDYVRNILDCQSLLMGSAMGNTTTGLSMLFDIVDSHAYFNHPVFPKKGWDQNDYYVENGDLTRQEYSKTLTSLAGFRVLGKPFSVSEYDHPYPDQYAAEMYPMLAAYASYQDWDAVYTFCSDVIESNESKNRKISGYFDQTHNPVKTAASPVAARIFRTGAIESAENCVWMKVDEEKERNNLQKFRGWSVGNPSVWGFEPVMAMTNRIGLLWNCDTSSLLKGCDVEEAKINIEKNKDDLKKASAGLADIKEKSYVYWEEEKGTFCARGKNAFVYVGHKESPELKKSENAELNNFEFKTAGDFATLMGVRNAKGKWIFFAGSWSGNKGEQLREYEKTKPYSASNEVVLHGSDVKLTSKPPYSSKEAVCLSVSGILKCLGNKMKLTSLSEKGMPLSKAKKGSEFELSENSGTLWYLIEP